VDRTAILVLFQVLCPTVRLFALNFAQDFLCSVKKCVERTRSYDAAMLYCFEEKRLQSTRARIGTERIGRMESKRKEPKAPKPTLAQTTLAQTPVATNTQTPHTHQHHTFITLNQGKECPLRATPAARKPWRATAHRSGTHNPDSAQERHSASGGH
jgi:hypothetical protein